MLYIIEYAYNPNTASGNRLLGYFRQWDKMGVEAKVYYLAPSTGYDKVSEKFQHIKFEYCWNRLIPYKKFIKRFFINKYIQKITRELVPGDIVYTYTISLITEQCLKVSGVKVFAEVTEHPKVCSPVADPCLLLDEQSYIDTILKLSGLFVISNPLKHYFQQYGIPSSKIHIINMTVDPSRFIGLKKQPSKIKYIAYCGTASNTKDGVDELIKAFYLVTKTHSDVKLMIIGKTPQNDEANKNLELINNLGLKEKVIFTGIVSFHDMPQLLKNAEIMALDRPDNMQAKYGFPTKLGEYLLSGNPVVVTAVGDIPYYLENGVSALIVPPSDATSFSQSLIWILDNPDKAKIIGENGRKVAMAFFNSQIESEKIIDHFMNE